MRLPRAAKPVSKSPVWHKCGRGLKLSQRSAYVLDIQSIRYTSKLCPYAIPFRPQSILMHMQQQQKYQ